MARAQIQPKPRLSASDRARRAARKSRSAMDALAAIFTDQPCPICGHLTIVVDGRERALKFICEGSFCRWK